VGFTSPKQPFVVTGPPITDFGDPPQCRRRSLDLASLSSHLFTRALELLTGLIVTQVATFTRKGAGTWQTAIATQAYMREGSPFCWLRIELIRWLRPWWHRRGWRHCDGRWANPGPSEVA
jgi:hypothetical protein